MIRLKRRFNNINRERLRRLLTSLAPEQRGFVELLPLLFHVNHPMMPGYVGTDTPQGVADYSPSDRQLQLARHIARSFTTPRRAHRVLDVQALYLMGSTATIAHSTSSDFDVWLCHREGLGEGIARLRRKADAVSAWAASVGVEVHFFLMSAEAFRERGAEALSTESSGSAQHHLLLDEFYRTALLLAGRAPLWWLVPAEFESDYDAYVQTLVRHRFVKRDDFIDFGPVAAIQPTEFFGATLWQLTKAIASPHKSLLKILLLEAYAADHPDIDLLSLRFKRAVFAGEKRLDALDAYVLMLDKLEEHLRAKGDATRLELARRSFYFKTGVALSRPGPREPDWRRETVQAMAERWGWDQWTLDDLDALRSWKVDRVLEERRSLVEALTATYKSLSRFVRAHAEFSRVSERDMTVLGRKLFTAFELKSGKVELVNLGLSSDLGEAQLEIHSARPNGGEIIWSLHRGRGIAPDSRPSPALRRASGPLELLAWAHFNGLGTLATRVTVEDRHSDFDANVAGAVLDHLRRHLDPQLPRSSTLDDLAAAPRALACMVFVNLRVDPQAAHTREGRLIASARGDALSFSGFRTNLVQEVDYLLVTSWGEILTRHHEGPRGLVDALCEHLTWVARAQQAGKPIITFGCSAPRQGSSVASRVEELFRDVSAWYLRRGDAPRRRYVLRTGTSYHLLLAEDGAARHEFSGSGEQLVRALGRPNAAYTATRFDARSLDDPLLARLYEANRPGVVQVFDRELDEGIELWVLDEHGALYTERRDGHDRAIVLRQLGRFLEAVNLRQCADPDATVVDCDLDLEAAHAPPEIRFYRIQPDGRIERTQPPADDTAGHCFDVKVIGESAGSEPVYTLLCEDVGFSTREHATRVFDQVAKYVLGRRRGGETYPIYITDIDLSGLPRQEEQARAPTTIHYLHYKQRVERRLNDALARVVAARTSAATGSD
ncbi:MAG: class I adenylate cyclase [Ectothiorhodospiraceae bacterium]|nr:class I adenylate cyclase [Chromatiales bacterium]MCP5155675.1 class I adenylate cyclase [Ectothiorhodospiraceae bacterium]